MNQKLPQDKWLKLKLKPLEHSLKSRYRTRSPCYLVSISAISGINSAILVISTLISADTLGIISYQVLQNPIRYHNMIMPICIGSRWYLKPCSRSHSKKNPSWIDYDEYTTMKITNIGSSCLFLTPVGQTTIICQYQYN